MANEPEEAHQHHDEEEGGPTKTFLEHLEDLRWVLMKCGSVVLLAFLVCLFASPVVVSILKRPLVKAQIRSPGNNPTITFQFGTNQFGPLIVDTNQAALFGTNQHTTLHLVPVQTGTNLILGLKPSANPTEGIENHPGVHLINLGPASAFFLAMEMAIYGGIALSSPFLLFFIGQFVFPALRINERRYTYWGVGLGTLLFMLGVCFCYFILMPIALKASVGYAQWMGFSVTEWRAEDYIRFVSKLTLALGLGFELPVVILVLVKIGIINYRQLAGFRRFMIVINLIIGAILAPEVFTTVLIAIPLQILYEISVWIAWYWDRQETKRRGAIELSDH